MKFVRYEKQPRASGNVPVVESTAVHNRQKEEIT